MSIRWFRTQHPQPVIGGGSGSGIHPAMLHALLINFLAFSVFAIVLIWLRYRLAVMEQQVESAYATKALSSNVRSAR
jgi:heme exporter protein C